MVGLLNELDFSSFIKEEHPYLGTFTHSVNTIKGGIKTNIIPDRCETTMDIRTLPGQDHDKVISTIQASIDGLAGQDHDFQCELETMVNKPGIEANLSEKYTARIIEIIKKAKRDSRLIGLNYFTDGAVIVPELNIPFLIFGPGNSTYAHKNNEEVEITNCFSHLKYTKKSLNSRS
jgi:succinyl-diaminopimelate desuccinylase